MVHQISLVPCPELVGRCTPINRNGPEVKPDLGSRPSAWTSWGVAGQDTNTNKDKKKIFSEDTCYEKHSRNTYYLAMGPFLALETILSKTLTFDNCSFLLFILFKKKQIINTELLNL